MVIVLVVEITLIMFANLCLCINTEMSLQLANNPSTEIDPMQHRIALVPNHNKVCKT